MSDATSERFEYEGVRFGDEGVADVEGGRVGLYVPRAQIDRLTVRYGARSLHPILQLVMGLLLVGLGLLPAIHLVMWAVKGGTIHLLEVAMIVMLIIGVWLIIDAPRRGYLIDVAGSGGRKRLLFASGASKTGVEAFAGRARERFGYDVQIDLKDA